MNIDIISHCYIDNSIYKTSDLSAGTTELYSYFKKQPTNKVLFCGVLYMAEDILALTNNNTQLFLPEVTISDNGIVQPRCPMAFQFNYDELLSKISKYDLILSYINMPSYIKEISDGIYSGTQALDIISTLNKYDSIKSIGLIGDKNVNWWIDKTSSNYNFKITPLTPSVLCPPHNNYSTLEFFEKSQKNNIQLHSEASQKLLEYGLNNNIYIGGTSGMIANIKANNNSNPWVIPTIQNFIDNIRSFANTSITDTEMQCAPMNYTTYSKVIIAKELIEKDLISAEITITSSPPYYKLCIINSDNVMTENGENNSSRCKNYSRKQTMHQT